jgi:hypothetical protein
MKGCMAQDDELTQQAIRHIAGLVPVAGGGGGVGGGRRPGLELNAVL